MSFRGSGARALEGSYDGYSVDDFDYDESLSMVSLDERGKVEGCFFVSVLSDRLFVDLLYTKKKSPNTVLDLMRGVLGEYKNDPRDFTTLSFFSEADSITALAKRIVGEGSLIQEEASQMAVKLLERIPAVV